MAREIILQKLPVGWSYNLLDNIAERCSGHTPSKSFPEYWNGGIKWISLADSFRLDKGYVYETDKQISLEGIKNSSAEVHPAETVVLSRDAGVGKSGVMATPMAVSQHFIAWKCDNKEKLHSWYLYNWLQLNKEEFERQAVGSTIKTIGLPYFKKLRIAVPPFDEQKKIAQILSAWDKAISVTEKLLTNSQQQKKALMQQLLTGKKRLGVPAGSYELKITRYGSIPKDWDYPAIKEICTQVSEKNSAAVDHPVLSCSKYDGFVDSLKYFNKKVYSDDLSGYRLIHRGCFGFPSNHIEEGSIGLQNLYDTGIVSPIYVVFRASPTRVDKSYLYAVLKTDHYKQIFGAATNASVDRRGSLRWKEFNQIHVPLPPLKEQQKIAAVLSAADAEISILEKKLTCLKDEKKALMQQLLTGKRRVKVEAEEVVSA